MANDLQNNQRPFALVFFTITSETFGRYNCTERKKKHLKY